MLSTVLRNLLSNAVKYTNTDGQVIGNTRIREDGILEISVTDTGVGMSADLIAKLFRIGEKVGMPGTERERSTGLGLLLCKEFVDKHGGRIWAESRIGIGSTFYFTIPERKQKI